MALACPGKAVEAVVLHAESPGEIFLAPVNQLSIFDDLMDQVAAYAESVVHAGFSPPTGHCCVVKHDDAWHRGVSLGPPVDGKDGDDELIVFLADLGKEVVVKPSELLPMSKVLMEKPFIANHCRLAGFEVFLIRYLSDI